MAAVVSHLADTSALARGPHPAVAAASGPLIETGPVASISIGDNAGTCPTSMGPGPTEQPAHPPVAQQIHVGDRVRVRDHPRDQPGDLHLRVHPAGALIFTGLVTRRCNPARSARRSTGPNPPHDTRFGSSNAAVNS
jgi:hypothetical protein